MSEPVQGILIAHGSMAPGIVDAVLRITGAEPDALIPLSNEGLAPAALAERVKERLRPGPTILFTDLQSGSCGFAARVLTRERPDVVVVSGVNLTVLLEFVLNRHLPITELVPRLLAKGRAAIGCAPAELSEHGDRAASGG